MSGIKQAIADYVVVDAEGNQEIGGIPVSKFAAMLPFMTEEEFEALEKSVKEFGLQAKIKTDAEGKIVNGRNRLLACLVAGVVPHFVFADHGDKDQVIIEDMQRRHMTAGQRALVWLKLNGNDDSPEKAEPGSEDEQEASSTPKKTRVKVAKEAGVSTRSLQQAANVKEKGTPSLIDAVAEGKMSVRHAEKVAGFPESEQNSIVEEHIQATLEEGGTGKSRAIRNTETRTFNFDKWAKTFANKISTMKASVPEDQLDRCANKMAEVCGSTIRMERETEQMLDAVTIVPWVEDLISGISKSERASSELAIANHYASVVKHKDVDAAMTAIAAIVEGLTAGEKKKTLLALSDKYAIEEKVSKKAGDYLPKLPDDHIEAVEVVGKEIKSRVDGLLGYEDWDKSGRREAGRSWKKSVQNQLKRMTVHAGLDIAEGEEATQIEYPTHLATDAFRKIWAEFLAARKKEKKPIGDDVQRRQLKILGHFDEAQATEIVGKAIEGSWKGIPLYRDLSNTQWCGRRPAHPPEPKPGVPGEPVSRIVADARAKHGKLDTSRVPVRTVAEAKAAIRR